MSTYEISKSSLLSLKAEILKKQEEINKSKLENKSFIPASVSHAKKVAKVHKNKGVDYRAERDYEEDPDLLRKSRQMLEAKSRLYDKLSNTQSNFDDNKHYLVNFNKKSNANEACPNFDNDPDDTNHHPESDEEFPDKYEDDNVDSDNEWTEYVDALGRTRTCLKKDLNYMRGKDERHIGPSDDVEEEKKIEDKVLEDNVEIAEADGDFTEKSELLSSDMKRELLRQQWEQEEAILAQKSNVHYQDVLFNEARTHGVGYFAFSKDETERAKQQVELEKLRKETAQKQQEAHALKKTREKLLKNRIRAAQNRKRARLGLPPLESDEELESDIKTTEIATEITIESKEPTDEEKERELKRQQHVRPWDIGKEGVEAPKEHYVYSQEEWNAKKREERIPEFAPPVIVATNTIVNKNPNKSTTKRRRPLKNKPLLPNKIPINPYKVQATNLTVDSSSEDEDRLLNDYKQVQPINNPTDLPAPNFDRSEPVINNPTNPPASNFDRSEPVSVPFVVTQIVNELTADDSSSSSDGEDRLLQAYRDSHHIEIPPPPTFDYYGPAEGQRTKTPNVRHKNAMEDSIMMGLRFLREKSERTGGNREDNL